MKKIELFSQYDADILFYRIKIEIDDAVRQWPDDHFSGKC